MCSVYFTDHYKATHVFPVAIYSYVRGIKHKMSSGV